MLEVWGAVCNRETGQKTAYELLRHAVSGSGKPMPEILRKEHGKPYFEKGPDFSLTHARTMALCAVSSAPVGLDAETIRPIRPGAARLSMNPPEQAWLERQPDFSRAFLTLWTAKEAYVKWSGVGFQWRPKSVCVQWVDGNLTVPDSGVRFVTMEHHGVLVAVCTTLEEPVAWHWPQNGPILPGATGGC